MGSKEGEGVKCQQVDAPSWSFRVNSPDQPCPAATAAISQVTTLFPSPVGAETPANRCTGPHTDLLSSASLAS